MQEPKQQKPRRPMSGILTVTVAMLIIFAAQQLGPMVIAFWDPDLAQTVRGYSSEAVIGLTSGVVNFWLGSSYGSLQKTAMLKGGR